MWALIVSGVVHELTSTNPAGRYNAALLWVACDVTVQVGYTYDGTNFAPPPAPATPTAAQVAQLQAQAALLGGLTITSTSAPAINGTYACDPVTQFKVSALIAGIAVNGTFPGGAASYPFPNAAGALITFPSVAEFKAFATAYETFVAGCELYAAGLATPLPSASVAIA